jgi:ribosomal protein S7
LTAQGHPRAIFNRAIENGNLLVAEMAARELGRISLDESLALTALVVQKDPGRRSRYAVRWLLNLLQEDENLTIEEAALAASALAALGGRGQAEALATLSATAERATRQRQVRRVAS